MSTAKKHKSSQDFKTQRLANAVKKLGGQVEADTILVQWQLQRVYVTGKVCRLSIYCFLLFRRKRSADWFLHGIIVKRKLLSFSKLVVIGMTIFSLI